MLDRDAKIDIAIALHPQSGRSSRQDEYDLEEVVGLTEALGVTVALANIVPLRDIHVGKYFGSGKIEEIRAAVLAHSATLVIVNAALSPIQQRNLERVWNVKVIDRTGLILEIFGIRAATKEGRLQVEMARLGYERSRLVRTWTHLERQRGGQGFLAGPGETQIESDRRVLNDKITRLRRDLDGVRRTRGLQRQKRQRAPERVVALVGYTNAGKSSLFNILTKGGVLAKGMLFATLDTTHRVLPLPDGKPAVLSDTVGFIADLPTDLITSFRATLEEVKEADLLVHVRDISDPLTERRKGNVLEVLGQLEAGPEHAQMMIEVWNKADLLDDEARVSASERAAATRANDNDMDAFVVSCASQMGIAGLQAGIEKSLTEQDDSISVLIPPKAFHVRAWLHNHGQVEAETLNDDGTCAMQVLLSDADMGKFTAKHSNLVVSD